MYQQTVYNEHKTAKSVEQFFICGHSVAPTELKMIYPSTVFKLNRDNQNRTNVSDKFTSGRGLNNFNGSSLALRFRYASKTQERDRRQIHLSDFP